MTTFGDKKISEKLETLLGKTRELPISKSDKIVVFSDLHLGEGGKRDDFEHNGELFETILREYYYKSGYRLILNGDIDELLRFSEKSIMKRWGSVYDLFKCFNDEGKIVKIYGNHDIELKRGDKLGAGIKNEESVILNYEGNRIMIFHGHQAGPDFTYNTAITKPFLRIFAKPFGIKNYLVAGNSKKKYMIERRIYNFAKKNRLVALIGHTHRPLFESMSKKDNLRFKIEQFCRIYPESSDADKVTLEKKIKLYKKELLSLIDKNSEEGYVDTLYNTEPFVPSMFNSGSCIGKRGLTAVEISGGEIKLMYWFDKVKSNKYFDFNGHKPVQLKDFQYYHVTLKTELLDYLFTRIKLLS